MQTTGFEVMRAPRNIEAGGVMGANSRGVPSFLFPWLFLWWIRPSGYSSRFCTFPEAGLDLEGGTGEGPDGEGVACWWCFTSRSFLVLVCTSLLDRCVYFLSAIQVEILGFL